MNADNIISLVKSAQIEANGSNEACYVVFEFGKLKIVRQSILHQSPYAETLEICRPIYQLDTFATSRRKSYQGREVA